MVDLLESTTAVRTRFAPLANKAGAWGWFPPWARFMPVTVR